MRERSRPPTEKQLEFIENLFCERNTEDLTVNPRPRTLEEASELIEALLACPYHTPGGEGL